MINVPQVWQTENWNDIYIAALLERDPEKVLFLIQGAESAIFERARELLKASGDIFEEEEALNDALYALHGRNVAWRCMGNSRKQRGKVRD